MIIQFCGLSGSGKTTLANAAKKELKRKNIAVEVIDGDEYRKQICPDLGFSKEHRHQNIRRLSFIAGKFSSHGIVPIICAINPYDEVRQEIKKNYPGVYTVFIDCGMDTLMQRDTKGLYRRALLPEGHPDKISNLSGLDDPFEPPEAPDLIIKTDFETIESSVSRFCTFILDNLIKDQQLMPEHN